MSATRRDVLKAGGTITALMSLSSGAQAMGLDADTTPAYAVYDSRLPESRAFVAGATLAGLKLVDVAHEGQTHWRFLRNASKMGAVIGLTRWSDYVSVRSALTGQRVRPVQEERLETGLIQWRLS